MLVGHHFEVTGPAVTPGRSSHGTASATALVIHQNHVREKRREKKRKKDTKKKKRKGQVSKKWAKEAAISLLKNTHQRKRPNYNWMLQLFPVPLGKAATTGRTELQDPTHRFLSFL